jgi:hypothetical protein
MKERILAVLMLLASLGASAQSPLADIQGSHIDGNVPDQQSFDASLRRDLLAYFRTFGVGATARVQYRFLREGPTQSGVSYPKYYLWVKVLSGGSVLREGAVRVAAIDRGRFEVTNFLSTVGIRSDPSQVGLVFPSALVTSVLSAAGVK